MRPPPYDIVADGLRLAVRVTPRAARTGLAGLAADADGRTALKVCVTTAPEGGRANGAVIKLLAKTLGCPKSAITLCAGATDRRKLLHIAGEGAELARTLAQRLD